MSCQSTILIVDDVPVVRSVLRRAITRIHPYALITEAATVQEALRTLQHVRITCTVTDFHLPDGIGLTVLATARQHDATMPVFVMSADAHVADQALAAGATAFFAKPLDIRQVMTLFTQVC